jgi:hypothetical protein
MAFWLDLEGMTDVEIFQDLKEHGKWESSLWQAEPYSAELCDQKRDDVYSHAYSNCAGAGESVCGG